jgi:hypothetical protein
MGPRKAQYKFSFEEMAQINVATNYPRPMRRRISAGASVMGGERWEWNEHGSWLQYDDHGSEQCAVSRKAGFQGTTMHVTIGQAYNVDFANMTQANVHTGFQRNVRSVPVAGAGGGAAGAGAAAAAAAPAPPAAAAAAPAKGKKRKKSAGAGAGAPSVPNTTQYVMFTKANGPNFEAITKWQQLTPGTEYNPKDVCPIVADEYGDDASDPVVKLPWYKVFLSYVHCEMRGDRYF